MSNEIFDEFNHGHYFDTKVPIKKYLNLSLQFSITDFFRNGIIWMKYTFEIRDKNDKLISGSTGIQMILILKKEGEYWKIVRVFESP
jgi:hypothetical protein